MFEKLVNAGKIQTGLNQMEEYLMAISGIDAEFQSQYINGTSESMADVLAWRDMIYSAHQEEYARINFTESRG